MKNTLRFFAVLVFGTALIVAPAGAQREKHSVTISTGDEKTIADCDQVRMEIGDEEMARAEQTQTIAGNAIESLKVIATKNGGMHVQGWDRAEYQIKACLIASGHTEAAARDLVSQLKLSVENGRVTVEGPASKEWVAYLIIQAPRGAVLDLTSTNGPIGVSELSGSIEARNVNGPLTLTGVNGQVHAEVQNGPITVNGGGGDFKLSAQNGPLTVALSSGEWAGGQLEGHTQNGPLTLALADGFQSSVLVEASKHSPVSCFAGPCKEAMRTWDQPNVIRLGDSEPVVRLSTVNGPVTLTSPDAGRMKRR